jgi:hypothetical protein
MYAMLTIHMLTLLGESLSDLQSVFYLYIVCHKPEWISNDAVKIMSQQVPADALNDIKAASKKDFFELALKSRGILRAKGAL